MSYDIFSFGCKDNTGSSWAPVSVAFLRSTRDGSPRVSPELLSGLGDAAFSHQKTLPYITCFQRKVLGLQADRNLRLQPRPPANQSDLSACFSAAFCLLGTGWGLALPHNAAGRCVMPVEAAQKLLSPSTAAAVVSEPLWACSYRRMFARPFNPALFFICSANQIYRLCLRDSDSKPGLHRYLTPPVCFLEALSLCGAISLSCKPRAKAWVFSPREGGFVTSPVPRGRALGPSKGFSTRGKVWAAQLGGKSSRRCPPAVGPRARRDGASATW